MNRFEGMPRHEVQNVEVRKEQIPQEAENRSNERDVPKREFISERTVKGLLDAMLEKPVVQFPETISPAPEVQPSEVLQRLTSFDSVSVDEAYEDLYQPSFFNRLAKKPWVRRVFGAIGLFGAVEGAKVGKEAYENVERMEAAQEQIVDAVYESSLDLQKGGFTFEHKIDTLRQIAIDEDITMTSGELLNEMSRTVTDNANEQYTGGLRGLVENIAETTFDDGTKGIDALKFYIAYSDQIPVAPEATQLLQKATGLSENELDMFGDIVRESVLKMPDIRMGVTGREFYGAGDLNVIDYDGDPRELHEQRFHQVMDLALESVKTLNVDSLPETARDEATKVIQGAIRATIDADNAWTIAANYTENWDKEIVRSAFSTSPDEKGSAFDRLIEADQNAEFALKKLAALEGGGEGHLHDLARAIDQKLDEKGERFFEEALKIDPSSEAFQKGREVFGERGL